MKPFALVRYKTEQIYGTVFRDTTGKDRYVYLQPNAQDGEPTIGSADVSWYDSEEDAKAAAELVVKKAQGVSFCVVETKDILTSVITGTRVAKCRFTEKGLLPV